MNDLSGEDKYLLNLNISVCMEYNGPCLLSVPVFINTKIPKEDCGTANAGFLVTGTGKYGQLNFSKTELYTRDNL